MTIQFKFSQYIIAMCQKQSFKYRLQQKVGVRKRLHFNFCIIPKVFRKSTTFTMHINKYI